MPSLIGNKPNQVPSNGDLGTMAFREQDQFYATNNNVSMRNRIINGAMTISQRGTSFTGLTNGGSAYTLDRWFWNESGTATAVQSVTQDSSAPNGFVNSLKIQTTTAQSSLNADNAYKLFQIIEGNNVSDLGWGTANAKTITISFWVRSSLTGTFGGFLRNGAGDRYYVFSYTINSADTWEYKTVTIAGDTSGTWLKDNGLGLFVTFSFGTGSTYQGAAGAWGSTRLEAPTGQVNVAGILNATFYITGVQLEVGTQATSFEYRQYQQELALCQRYCNVYGGNIYSVFGTMSFGFSGTGFSSATVFPVEMRAVPTVAYTGNTRAVSGSDSIAVTSVAFNDSNSSKKIAIVEPSVASGITTNRGYYWSADNDASARVIFSAEL